MSTHTLEEYLESIRAKILAEAKDMLAKEPGADLADIIEGLTDEYAQGFCEDQDARAHGEYPYDGSREEYMDYSPSYADMRREEW